MRQRLPPQLLKHILDGNVLLFLGPQIVEAEVGPQQHHWLEALKGALRLGISLREADDLERFLATAEEADIAQAARLHLGQETYLQLCSNLETPKGLLPPPIVYALRSLPIQTWLTTNNDSIIEGTFLTQDATPPSFKALYPLPGDASALDLTLDQTPRPGPAELVKLFGDPSVPESLVLTTDDLETYWRRRPGFAAQLTELLKEKTPLFIGYNLKDTAFLRLYSLIGPALTGIKRRGFALLSSVTSFDTLWWSRRALRILPLEEGEDLESAIRDISQECRRQLYPGVALEPEASPLALVEGPATATGEVALSPQQAILQAQLTWAANSWLIHPPGRELDLARDCVPRRLDGEVGEGGSREAHLKALLGDGSPEGRRRLEGPQGVSIEDVIAQGGRIMLTGPSGSGKTTLLLRTLNHIAQKAMDVGSRTMAFYLPLSYLTPVEWDPEPDLIGRLTAHLIRLVSHVSPDSLRQTIEHALQEDRAVLLLDGLDEVRPEDIPAVRDVLERLRRAYRDANIILTCRSDRWSSELLPDLPVYGLLPLSDAESAELVEARLGEDGAPILLGAIASGLLNVQEETPLTLSLACDHLETQGSLPTSLAELLSQHLLQGLRSGAVKADSVLGGEAIRCAQQVAFDLLGEGNKPLTADHLSTILQSSLKAQDHPSPEEGSRRLLDTLRQESGLLVGPSIQGTFAFRHSRLMEQLAAMQLQTKRLKDPTRGRVQNPRWNGVWPLFAETLGDGTALMRALDKVPTARGMVPQVASASPSFKLKWVLAKVTDDDGDSLLPEILDRLQGQLSDAERLDLYEAILVWDREHFETDGSRIDGRLVWGAIEGLRALIHDEGVAARGAALTLESWRGKRPSDSSEPWPQQVTRIEGGLSLYAQEGEMAHSRFINLPDVYIALTPVTVKMWRTFHPNHDLGGAGSSFQGDSHPAVGMSIWEAKVCAEWFGGRLPLEEEWDKAASWCPETERRRIFPWGDTWDPACCNTLETWQDADGFTTPIDQFGESGASASGCLDMAGNVLEWTGSLPGDGTDRWVLRGGSWMAASSYARLASRVLLKGDTRGTGIGLRLAFDESTD